MTNKTDWIPEEQIQLVQPKNAEQVEALRDDINHLLQYFDNHEVDMVDWLKEHPSVLTLVYVDEKPSVLIRIDDHENNPTEVGKRALEFSGCVDPDRRNLGLTQRVIPALFLQALNRSNQQKILARTHQHNKEAIAALVGLGFKNIGPDSENKDHKLFRLTRGDFHAKYSS